MAEKKSVLKKLFSKSNKDCCSIEIEEVKASDQNCCGTDAEKQKSDKPAEKD